MKKLLLSLFVGFVGIISFCSADFIGSFTCNGNGQTCGRINAPSDCENSFSVYLDGGGKPFTVYLNGGNNSKLEFYSGLVSSNCTYIEISGVPGFIGTTYPVIVNYGTDPDGGTCPDCPACEDQYTSLECQIQYNLIPVEDVDINYCVGNGLCPNECGSGTDLSGDLQYSNIYINSILHPGEENIFIDIPDYIQWDYSVDTGNFNLYVGSGYDMDYMNSIIKINSYRPTSSDFTNIFVSGLTLIFPYIFVLLLIVFIWKLIKRVFK